MLRVFTLFKLIFVFTYFLGNSSPLRLEYNKKCNTPSLNTVVLNKQTNKISYMFRLMIAITRLINIMSDVGNTKFTDGL